MGAHVIQHTRPRRKRGDAWSWAARHIVLLAVVVTAIIAASWLAPDRIAPPATAPATTPQLHAAPAPAPTPSALLEVDIAADLAGPPRATPNRVRQTTARAGIPLDAAVTASDEYEILSAAELDDISQARN